MNPDLVWQEMKAKMADNAREAQHRHMEGEAHRSCEACGAKNFPRAKTCTTCGVNLLKTDPDIIDP